MHQLHSRPRRRMPVAAGKLSLALSLCLCAGQLVSAPAASAATAPVTRTVATTAVTSAAAVATRVSITRNKSTVALGSPVVITARVVDPRTGKAVSGGTMRLQAWRNGRWNDWQVKRVYSTGTVAFASRPRVTGGFRVVFGGVGTFRGAASGGVKVWVQAGNANVVNVAQSLRGSPYRYGAAGPRAFDCSGFTQYVYKKAVGKNLPHKASAQARYGRPISKAQAQPGDLIIMAGGGHAGIYAGQGYMYDSPRAGTTVGRHKIWTRSYVVRRLVG